MDVIDVHDIDCIYWPDKSSDLNITENVWGRLARKVYENGRQFKNLVDLQDFIMDA